MLRIFVKIRDMVWVSIRVRVDVRFWIVFSVKLKVTLIMEILRII